jgi:hypothetical protein
MDPLSPEMTRLVAGKDRRRRRLASLPFHEKVRLLIELQKMAAPILEARGRRAPVWPEEPPAADAS